MTEAKKSVVFAIKQTPLPPLCSYCQFFKADRQQMLGRERLQNKLATDDDLNKHTDWSR
jgi:hypothetical protein